VRGDVAEVAAHARRFGSDSNPVGNGRVRAEMGASDMTVRHVALTVSGLRKTCTVRSSHAADVAKAVVISRRRELVFTGLWTRRLEHPRTEIVIQ
jgi:hypothetical protein